MVAAVNIDGRSSKAKAEAIEWHIALNSARPLSHQESAAFEHWKASSENAAAFAQIRQIGDLFRNSADQAVLEKSKKLEVWVRSQRRLRKRLFGAAIAASIVLAMGSALTLSGWHLPRMPWQKGPGKAYFTAIGQRSNIVLEDGSGLALDTNSAATVSFGKDRLIRLDRGQAYFKVMKGDRRPFVVQAGDRQVVATGTAFDVRLHHNGIEVTLIEGRVIVDRTAATGGAVRAIGMPDELRPGERLFASFGGASSIGPANLETATGWTKGIHVFKGTRLKDALVEVSRYTETPIILNEVSLSEIPVNGVFSIGRPGEFATMVAETNGLSMTLDPTGAIRLARASK